MNVSAKLELDKRYQKKNGTFPIKLLLVIDRKTIRISTGYGVEVKHWLEKSQSIRSTCKAFQNVTRVNNLLHKQKSQALDVLTQLQDNNELDRLSIKEIKNRIKGKNQTVHIYDFCQQIIDELEGKAPDDFVLDAVQKGASLKKQYAAARDVQ